VEGNVDAGRLGENITESYLKLVGYEVLRRNFRFGHLEIDIVARKDRCVAFIEVKTRRNRHYGSAVEAVDRGKIQNIRLAAEFFLASYAGILAADEYRIDLVALDVDDGAGFMKLRHLRGIA